MHLGEEEMGAERENYMRKRDKFWLTLRVFMLAFNIYPIKHSRDLATNPIKTKTKMQANIKNLNLNLKPLFN